MRGKEGGAWDRQEGKGDTVWASLGVGEESRRQTDKKTDKRDRTVTE